ncbi:DUF2652 domain-containing protein [Candidatus Berkelbacteria bacterium]|nr:DUF2652 domain-containing protein [Candidatus Berkelbacteria bacterium]
MVDIGAIQHDWAAKRQRQASYVGARRSGVIILADISGYTELLTSTQAETSARIAHHLTGRVFDATTEAFIVNEIEGDALFVYAVEPPGGPELFKATLVQLEAYADAFYHAMEELSWSNLKDDPNLRPLLSRVSMKFIVHAGHWVFDEIGPFVKLVGADVILAHRLLKNQVQSDSYFLMTKPFLALSGDAEQAKVVAQIEEIKHFGSVDVGVREFDYQAEHAARHGTSHDHLTRKSGVTI